MTTKPLRPCAQPGCPNLVREGRFCSDHQQQSRTYDDNRGTAAERGYDSRWRKASRAYLRRNPLCVSCYSDGRTVPANTVDHIIPHKGDPTLFWDERNWQSMCKRCHDRKTAREDGGFGNKRGRGSQISGT